MDGLTSPSEKIWFKRWFRLSLRPEGFGEGGKNINKNIYGDIILKAK